MPTLADIVAIPELGLRTLAATASGRQLRWVATSELADPTPYLEGGELLLTTGLVPPDWSVYVDHLVRAGVVAVGFGVGLSSSDVPPELVDAAAREGLGLVAVPEVTPFIAISKAVAELLASEESARIRAALELQQELVRTFLGRGGAGAAFRALARATAGAAALVDGEGAAVTPADFRLGEPGRRALVSLRNGTAQGAATEVDDGGVTVVQPVDPDGDGPFLVLTTRTAPDGLLRAALVTLVALLSLDSRRARAADETDLRLRDRTTRLVLDGNAEAARGLALVMRAEPTIPASVRIVRADGLPAGERGRLAVSRPDILTADGGGDELVAVVTDAQAGDLVDDLRGRGGRVGTGPLLPVGEASLSDAGARTALALTAPGPLQVVTWDDRFRGDVRAALPDPAARVLADQILGDVGDDPVLLDSLYAFLNHLGHWQPAADELGIHRNTLRSRMDRVAAITGRSLDTAAARADLWIAVVAAREDRAAGGARSI
ncbi:PucR family transcriptional regulator [Pseudonocardia endophytica]|uniref:PucR family transcriptional regulator n=1 Tax=Pseudonocardia endophytica TaxID=401976 RepID=UPI0014050AE5|nr:PucR family transcriptional regulator [Pseudonocardia endophytica]